jgi:hypothetical protein
VIKIPRERGGHSLCWATEPEKIINWDGAYVRAVGIRDYVICVSEVIYKFVFFVRDGICVCSMCGREFSEGMIDDGSPVAGPSFWMCFVIIEKLVLFCDGIIPC